jgi:hypothetical protein
MTTPSEPEPERTELSTQVLPAIPTVEEMKTWDPEKVLRWIQQRPGITLKGDNLEIFKKGDIGGIAFLASDVEFYRTCGLPRGVGLTLEDLAKEVEEGKFIPWMLLRPQLTVSRQPGNRQKEEG